jgi:hypothetical protein
LAALISSVFWASVNVKRKIEQYILICSFGDTEWQKTKIEIIQQKQIVDWGSFYFTDVYFYH